MKEEEKLGSELDDMFPAKRVPVDGLKKPIRVHPISVEDIGMVVDAFGEILVMVQGGVTYSELSVKAIKQILKILPYCVQQPVSTIPGYALPDILQVVIDQNFSKKVLGNWQALIQKLAETAQKTGLIAAKKKKEVVDGVDQGQAKKKKASQKNSETSTQ